MSLNKETEDENSRESLDAIRAEEDDDSSDLIVFNTKNPDEWIQFPDSIIVEEKEIE